LLVIVTFEVAVRAPLQEKPVKRVYLTVPPAWNPPVIVAESETGDPIGLTVADRLVLIVGLALLTVRDAQELIIGLLLASPEYEASNP
jgi:hypothetical protein